MHSTTDWPLTGRNDELRYVGDLLAGGGSGVVLAGPVGVGKTRLAHEVLRASQGYATEWVSATRAAASIPFGPLVHLLPVPLPLDHDRLALFGAVSDALAERSGGRRLMMAVDDAHLLDPASAALVLHLALTRRALLVVTVRSGEPAEDPVVALWKDGLARRIDLQALSQAETGAMVEAALGGGLEHATATWLFEATQGNPLFIRELVTAALSAKTLCRADGGAWRWSGETVASTRLMETVQTRLGAVSPTGRRALELVALGEPLDVRLLEVIAGPDATVDAERAGFLAVDAEGEGLRARLAHPLYGEVVRATLAPIAMRARYRQLARGLDVIPNAGDDDVLRQVVWRMEAGETSSPELLTRAARQASHQLDHDLARRLAVGALDTGAGFDAALALGEACNGLWRFGEAEAALAPWESTPVDERTSCRYLFQRVHALHWGLGRVDEARAYVERARGVRQGRFWQQLLQAVQAHLLAQEGRLDDALVLGRPLLEEPGTDERVRLQAASPIALALNLQGRTDTSLVVLDGVADIARRRADEMADAAVWVGAQRVVAMLIHGRLVELEALLMAMHDQAVARRDHHTRASAAMMIGRVCLQMGKVAAACRWLDEAVDPFKGSDPGGVLCGCLAVLSQARGQAGDAVRARAARDQARARQRPASRWQEGDLAVADVWVAVAEGDRTGAVRLACSHAERLAETPYFVATLLHQAVRLGTSSPDIAGRLTALARAGESPWLRVVADHGQALAAGDGAALELVATAFDDLGATLAAAEAAAQAARAHQRRGSTLASRRCAAGSRRLAGACGGARTHELADDEVTSLTRREREVAELAERGLANTDIAERLVLSVRTVESHLYRVYAKLGAHRRQDLARLLEEGRHRVPGEARRRLQ